MDKLQKPVGVYILTICLFLRFSIFQFISDFNAIHDGDHATPVLITVILLGRNVFVAGAAVWAFLGENEGRIALLAIVTLNVLWSIFNMITFASFSKNDSTAALVFNYLLNPIIWLVACWWYLNLKNVVKYYKRNEESIRF
jgi:hypothetical protein